MAQQEQKTDDRQKILEARMKELGISPSKLLRGEQLDSKHKVFVPIGVTEVDIALGDIPGLTAGSVIEFVGESSSGKTYLALKHAAEMHKLGKRVAFLNIENAFYEPRAQALGVLTRDKNLFELYESVGDGETWGELAKSLAKSGDYGLIIIDSVTAMIPQADYDKSLEDEPKIGAHARMTGRLAQKLVSICPETNTSVILINQYRYGQGVIKGTMVKKSTGGESIGFYAHYRLVISKMNGIGGQAFDEKKELIGGRSKVFVLKTRFGQPHSSVEFVIYYSPVESDPFVEFIMRGKAKQYELIKEVRKVLKYVTEDGVVIESKSPKEFIKSLKNTSAPEKLSKGDNSKTAFDYICRKIKFSDIMIEKLNIKLNSDDTEEDYGFDESGKELASLSPEEINEILG